MIINREFRRKRKRFKSTTGFRLPAIRQRSGQHPADFPVARQYVPRRSGRHRHITMRNTEFR